MVPPIDDKHSQACFFWFDEKPLLKIELMNARIFCILLLDASEAFFKLYQIFFGIRIRITFALEMQTLKKDVKMPVTCIIGREALAHYFSRSSRINVSVTSKFIISYRYRYLDFDKKFFVQKKF